MDIPAGLKLTGTPSAPRGRFLTATRSVEPGGLIARFTSASIVLPDSPSLQTACSYCLRTDLPVRACTGCRVIHYCSTSCQKSDWSLVHKADCNVTKRVKAEGHDFLPTPVRALVQMLLRADLKAVAAQMEGHADAFRRDRKEWKDMELQAMAALHYLGREATLARVNEALELLCKLQVNSFSMEDEDVGQSGMFANPALAMVNHSCMPNAFVEFSGRKAILRANQAIKEGDEVEISYIDCHSHRSHRQQSLKERWHFDCACPRCRDDLDVYQVAWRYPHIKLNAISMNPNLAGLHKPSLTGTTKETHIDVEKIYRACNPTAGNTGSSNDSFLQLQKHWKLCEPLRKASLFAVDPLAGVLGRATIYFGERNNFPFCLAVSCFAVINVDPFRSAMPFGPSRVKGLQMLASVLSNTAPISGSKTSSFDDSLSGRIGQALSKMDQATIAQAVLAIVVHWAPLAHSEEWQIYQEASGQLKDLESLPGREKERELIKAWVNDQDDAEVAMFFEYAVLKPLQELAGFALEIMDAEFGAK